MADNQSSIQQIQEPEFSFFKAPVRNTHPAKIMTLRDAYHYIIGADAQNQTAQLRKLTDPAEARNYKGYYFDYCTFSGVFTSRNDKALVEHSGLLCIDFDHLGDEAECNRVKELLLNDEKIETRLLFVSPSGIGLKWIVSIDLKLAPHAIFFQAIVEYMKKRYQLEVDKSGRDLSRPCYLPYDPHAVIHEYDRNKQAKFFNPYDWIEEKKKTVKSEVHSAVHRVYENDDLNDSIEKLTQQVELMHVDIAPSYDEWRDLGFALADGLGESGRSYYHRLSSLHADYSEVETDKKYTSYLASHNGNISVSTFFYLVKNAGISLANQSAPALPKSSVKVVANEESDIVGKPLALPTFSQDVVDKLPPFFRKIADQSLSKADADMLILGALTTLSAALPNVSGIYCRHRVYPNLFLFVTAPPASGKGRLDFCRQLVMPIHNELRQASKEEWKVYKSTLKTRKKENSEDHNLLLEPPTKTFFIPANSSSSSFIKVLNDNNGCGLMFETEGDTITRMFKSDFGNYSEFFRCTFQNEQIAQSRVTDSEFIEIVKPILSVVLAGTPQQINNLIPDAENGLFSRFMFYNLEPKLEWIDVFANDDQVPLEDLFYRYGLQFYELYKYLQNAASINFTMMPHMKQQFNAFFGKIQTEYARIFGFNITASVKRQALITYRLAMVLSVVRAFFEHRLTTDLICTQADFDIVMSITEVVMKHTAFVFDSLPSVDMKCIISSSDHSRKQQLFQALPQRFNRKEAIEVASRFNIARTSADRYIKQMFLSDLLCHESRGMYQKK